MIFRLLALIALPVMAYYLVKSVSHRFALTPRQNRILFFITTALLIVGVLVVMGRVPAQFILAPLGAAAAFFFRMLPALLRLLPFWQTLKSRMASAGPRTGDQSSTIRTRYLEMELKHNTGDMDGEVLTGNYAQRRLSTLSLTELLELVTECNSDPDSVQVLEAYLDRMHGDWREQAGAQQQAAQINDEATMTRPLALEILGLGEPASKDEIIKAHRHLMQKLHPDRGGSDYLAKKINAAKDFLLKAG
jgi:hypothetical protein